MKAPREVETTGETGYLENKAAVGMIYIHAQIMDEKCLASQTTQLETGTYKLLRLLRLRCGMVNSISDVLVEFLVSRTPATAVPIAVMYAQLRHEK